MKQRIVTGIVAGAGFLLFVYLGGFAFHALLCVMALAGFRELVTISGTSHRSAAAIVGYAGVVLLAFPWQNGAYLLLGGESSVWLAMFAVMAAMVLSKNRIPIQQSSILFFGVVYIGLGFHYMAATRWLDDGLFWTLLLFACIWLTDSGAYFTGRVLGKRPLWPAISPKKTVEGAIGGLVWAVIGALCFAWLRPELLSLPEGALLGCAIAVVGQMGDLIQSAYKRTFGVKDSGAILPGHGGVLDRCDSWLIVFPFVHLVLHFF